MRDNVYRHNRNRLGREEKLLLSIQIMPVTSIQAFHETGQALSLELRWLLIVGLCRQKTHILQSLLRYHEFQLIVDWSNMRMRYLRLM